MSLDGSLLNKPSADTSVKAGFIDLIDNVNPPNEPQDTDSQDDESTTPAQPLSKRNTVFSLKEQLARRKYRGFEAPADLITPTPTRGELTLDTSQTTRPRPGESSAKSTAQDAPPSVTRERFERGRKAIKTLFSRKTVDVAEGDTAIDMLYENQRGYFIFGLPRFSSKSLLNWDSPAWENGNFQPSPVDITNAQLPDPSWRWDWPTWYVDMSWDVDEEGWQYSFMFQNRFAWHGTHTFAHSFVRRRRWLRKRVRKVRENQAEIEKDSQTIGQGHKLNSDYFTIHPAKAAKAMSPSSEIGGTSRPFSTVLISTGEFADDSDEEEIPDMGSLLRKLRRAKVDREKVNLVLKFMDEGHEELHYLAEEMTHILSLLLFQYSRRNLLSAMVRKIDAASDHRNEHLRRNEPETSDEKQKIDDLRRAIEAADKEIQRLEFWSDIKDAVISGESFGGVDDGKGWDHGWQGVDQSGPAKAEWPKTDKGGHLAEESNTKKPP